MLDVARKSCVGYKKPKSGEFILRAGWTEPSEPCRNGHISPRNRFGHCVQCVRNYRATRQHFSQTTKRWCENNKERAAKLHRDWYKSNPENVLLNAARRNAKENDVPFALEVSDISIPEMCPVLGIPLVRAGGKRTANSPSLDRIIPDKGYVKGNVIVVSWRANHIKSDATIDELRKVAAFYADFG